MIQRSPKLDVKVILKNEVSFVEVWSSSTDLSRNAKLTDIKAVFRIL